MTIDVTVGGLACLDVVPDISRSRQVVEQIFGIDASNVKPGQLYFLDKPIPAEKATLFWALVGDAVVNAGGIVSNTGGSLHRLGFDTRLMTRLGMDTIGERIADIYTQAGYSAQFSREGSTSFTVVANLPAGRSFFHFPLRQWGYDDIDFDVVGNSKFFLAGYPNLIQSLWQGNGEGLGRILTEAKKRGATTMVDFSNIDPSKPPSQGDWASILRNYTMDIFFPSAEEGMYMLMPDRYRQVCGQRDSYNSTRPEDEHKSFDSFVTYDDVDELTGILIRQYGVSIAGVKIGEKGFYLKTRKQPVVHDQLGRGLEGFREYGREYYFPAFQPRQIMGTTGAGDALIAGFLGGMSSRYELEEAGLCAVMVAAECLEAADSTSSIRRWVATQDRIVHTGPLAALDLPGSFSAKKINNKGYHAYHKDVR